MSPKYNDIAHCSFCNRLTQIPPDYSVNVSVQKKEEAERVMPCFLSLCRYIDVDDVDFVEPDPPDFVMTTGRTRIGVEHTRMNRRVEGRRGDKQLPLYRRWQEDFKKSHSGEEGTFPWGRFEITDGISSFRERLTNKTKSIEKSIHSFDDWWLLLELAEGSFAGNFVENYSQLLPPNDSLFGKCSCFFFHRIQEIYGSIKTRFTHIIVYTHCHWVALPLETSPYNLRFVSPEIIEYGATLREQDLPPYISTRTRVYP